MNHTPKATHSILEKGRNCWKITRASHASMLVDCYNYYRAIHEAVSRARHSVFVLGWDIDSRIELLREDGLHGPRRFFDLIQWKARQNPNLMIYLNRWDYSLFLAGQREGLSRIRWGLHSPSNVHYVLDGVVPFGACHHQKIVVVDDEIAFSGGMDIALGRWDRRSHHPEHEKRVDPGGTYQPGVCKHFGPYHDIQMIVAGPVVRDLADLVRERWQLATGICPIPVKQTTHEELPRAWPHSTRVDFTNVQVGISLTMPPIHSRPGLHQVEQLYLDMIAAAENFIYMENQFFTHQGIARALNQSLREKPELRALLVSCYNPEGIMERKSMWHGRVMFRDILESGGVGDRVAMAYPLSRENGKEKPVRIHSKVMFVDDRYLRVGSSNLNNRSMALDTECDLVIEGRDEATRSTIATRRNDLIREHTGREIDDIEQIIQKGENVETFLNYLSHSRQHLCKINDEKYRYEAFARAAIRIADPDKPLLPERLNMLFPLGAKPHLMNRFMVVLMLIAAAILAWQITPLEHYTSAENLVPFFTKMSETPWAIPAAIGIYILGSMVFLPHAVLTAAAVLVFPPGEAVLVAMTGSLISAGMGFVLGRMLGPKSLLVLVGNYAEKINHYAKRGGIIGMTLFRMVPVAPFTVVNIGVGMTHVPFFTFVIGTFFGLLPGTVAFSIFGHSLLTLWQNPDYTSMLYAAAGLGVWIGIVFISHKLGRRWQNSLKSAGNA